MSVASYNLWLPWREVGLSCNILGLRTGNHWSQVGMQSGTTGINTVRAYSVTKQGKDHDKNGDYIRKWVPELEWFQQNISIILGRCLKRNKPILVVGWSRLSRSDT